MPKVWLTLIKIAELVKFFKNEENSKFSLTHGQKNFENSLRLMQTSFSGTASSSD